VAAWLEGFIHERLRVAKGKAKRPKTKHSVNLALSYIKRMYRWGAKYGRVADVAAGSVQLVENLRADHPDLRKKDPVGRCRGDVQKTLATAAGQALANEVMVLWHTGMRPGEVLSDAAVRHLFRRRHAGLHPAPAQEHLARPGAEDPARAKGVGDHRTAAAAQDRRADLPPPVEREGWDTDSFRAGHRPRRRRRGRAAVDTEPDPAQLRDAHRGPVRPAEAVTDMLGHDDDRTQRVYVEKTLRRAIAVAREVG
jgi:integrase